MDKPIIIELFKVLKMRPCEYVDLGIIYNPLGYCNITEIDESVIELINANWLCLGIIDI